MIHDRMPAAMQANFTRLGEFLQQQCQGATVHFLQNAGNWGDALIRAGTLKFLQSTGLDFTEHKFEDFPRSLWSRKPGWLKSVKGRNAVLLFGGGGAWVDYWDVSSYAERVSSHFLRTIVLPSTYALTPKLHAATYFCRDRFESMGFIPEAIFSDDMAFYLGYQECEAGEGEGYFVRTDKESGNSIDLPKNNRDVSLEGWQMDSVEGFFAAIKPYEVVHTDRLHVAIAACLLKKKLHLYEGGYFKNGAVFRSSIENNFPNTVYHRPKAKAQPSG